MPKIAVEVVSPDRPRRSFTTDNDGRVTIPAGVAVEGAVLSGLARQGGRRLGPGGRSDPRAAGRDPGSAARDEAPPPDAPGRRLGRGSPGEADRRGPDRRARRSSITNRTMNQDVSSQDPVLGLRRQRPGGEVRLDVAGGRPAPPAGLASPACRPDDRWSRTDARTIGPDDPQAGRLDRRQGDRRGDRASRSPAQRSPPSSSSVAAQMLTDGWGQSVTDDQGRVRGRRAGAGRLQPASCSRCPAATTRRRRPWRACGSTAASEATAATCR